MGAYAWAALTLPLFHLTERLNPTGDTGSWRPARVAALLVVGFVLSATLSITVALATSLALRDVLGARLASAEGTGVMFRYRLMYDLLACHLILTAGVARDYFVRYRLRLAEATLLRTELAEARLQVLRAQLNPHFLFNTLNAVAALVQTDPRGVRRMIALLSDLLRASLDGASEPEVRVEQELEMLRRYLEIMEIRFRGRLETSVAADPEVTRALVPSLILQPLVENAMKHGIGRASGPGRVTVHASRQGAELVLTVLDTGPGGSNGAPGASRTLTEQGGLGIPHTRERLYRLYGDEGRLELRSTEGGATVAEVRLPYHVDDVRVRLDVAPSSRVLAHARRVE
jgi:LytS/YehU family sensor histidine kinase